MMTSLMSIFDPSTSTPYLGWSTLAGYVIIMLGQYLFWNSLSTFTFLRNSLFSFLTKLFQEQQLVFVTLFLFIMSSNLLGLLPMVFSPTSHFSFNLILALTLWSGMMAFYMMENLFSFLSHLTPPGSPLSLTPLLVLIELISSLIRPLTLALRLMANIMAGHMILTLISKGCCLMDLVWSFPLFSVLTGMTMFEFAVAVVQAYVFVSLMSLYWEESGA